MKFTGKERDSETGLDYFGARYFSGAQGRFTTPDPLMASAKASNPQSWNRYAYVFNNPLRHIDPDGLEVPESCVKDEKCQIKVNVNIIKDKSLHNGNGLDPKQSKKADAMQNEAAAVLKNANVQLVVTPPEGSEGTVTGSGVRTDVSGTNAQALNVVFTDQTPFLHTGESINYNDGRLITYINVNIGTTGTGFSMFGTPTLTHEYGEQFLHVGQEKSFFGNAFGDFAVDRMMSGVSAGRTGAIQDLRNSLANKRYAVPVNPEANKPKQ